MLMKGANEATMKDLVHMVKQGGGFAQQLFIAAATVSSLRLMFFLVHKLIGLGVGHANRPYRRQERRGEGEI